MGRTGPRAFQAIDPGKAVDGVRTQRLYASMDTFKDKQQLDICMRGRRPWWFGDPTPARCRSGAETVETSAVILPATS